MSNVRISNTALDKYESCPRSYKYRYIDKLVSKTKSSALCFGIAIDAGINFLLENPNNLQGAIFRFDRSWCKQNDNHYKKVRLKNAEFLTFSKNDSDESLLTEKDKLDGKYIPWKSLRRKGHILLKAYQEQILPKIKKVISTQKTVKLVNNETNDEIIGIVDMIVELFDGKIALLDNKTSSIKYQEDSVKNSAQLAMYKWIIEETENLNIDALGYLVLNKKLLKNNVVKTQIIIDQVNDEKIDEVIHKINTTVQKIKNQEFDMNLSSCKTFYGKCDYFDICHNNDFSKVDKIEKKEIK